MTVIISFETACNVKTQIRIQAHLFVETQNSAKQLKLILLSFNLIRRKKKQQKTKMFQFFLTKNTRNNTILLNSTTCLVALAVIRQTKIDETKQHGMMESFFVICLRPPVGLRINYQSFSVCLDKILIGFLFQYCFCHCINVTTEPSQTV